MAVFKKVMKDSAKEAGILSGNAAAQNAQTATNMAADGMKLFQEKAAGPIIQNGTFATGKGNLFEYIEAAKFNTAAGRAGSTARAIITDAAGDPHAVADILIKDKGRTVKAVQAKFTQAYSKGKDVSAARSVAEQTGQMNKGWGQYDGMDRLIRKQENYDADGSLLDKAKKLAKARADSQGVNAKYYEDVYEHLTDETHYNGVSSGGTTIEEVRSAYDNPTAYAKRFERKQVAAEMKCTAKSMAKASFVTTGIVSGITNMFEVFKDKKNLADALHDVGADAIQSAARGGATGVISTAIRYKGIKAGSALLSDSLASTVMAGGLVDGGVALYSYAKGEITSEELAEYLVDTTAKATTTIYYTKAVTAIMGKAVNPIFPLAVYTTASYVMTATREIIKNANLNAAEHERMTALLQESTRQVNEYHAQLKANIARCEANQRRMLEGFIAEFDYNLATGENYDQALSSIVSFAEQAGIALQHVNFDEFSSAMRAKKTFVLE